MKPGRHVPARSDATIADAPRRAARLLCVALGLAAGPALAQPSPPPVFEVVGGALQKRANAVLALMGFSVVPDLTSSFLSISDAQAANPSLSMSQLAGGFTLGRETPLYLEGGIRGVEIGSVMFGKRLDDGTETYHSMELVRLAFPRRMYTQSHFDYAAEVIAEVKEKAASIRGVKITKQPKFLRHFTCECDWA